jgi:hypothetical protein
MFHLNSGFLMGFTSAIGIIEIFFDRKNILMKKFNIKTNFYEPKY